MDELFDISNKLDKLDTKIEVKIDKIDNKIDVIDEKINTINITLASQHEVLLDHTRRSLANEKAVEYLKQELKPVFKHVAIVNFIGKIIGLFCSAELALYLIHKFFK
jgi:hypothetical protein